MEEEWVVTDTDTWKFQGQLIVLSLDLVITGIVIIH